MQCRNQPLSVGEHAKIWRADDLGEVELLHAQYFKYSFARHTHEGAAIGVIEDGVESFYCRGATHVAPKGHVVFFNPGDAHTGEAADHTGWRFRMFYLDSALLTKAAESMSGDKKGDVPFFKSPALFDPHTASMLRRLHQSLEVDGNALGRESQFLWTFAKIAERHSDDPSTEVPLGDERSVVRTVRDYLESNYQQNVTLAEIRDVAGLSAYHLIRIFRKETGLPPHAYLEQIRVNRAKQMIRGKIAISEVALKTGFHDQSHFTRHFKKMTGVTPGQYQKSARP